MTDQSKQYSPQDLIDFYLDSARYGDTEDVRLALKENVAVNVAEEDGNNTALHMASGNNHLDILQILLDAGADVNAKNKEDNSPLHWACLNGHVQAVLMLLKAGANPSALNGLGRTPVDEALTKEHIEVLAAVNEFTGAPPIEDEQDDVEQEGQDVEEEDIRIGEGDMSNLDGRGDLDEN